MPEHVSFFRARALPRKRNAVVRHFEKWNREHRKAAKGFLRSTIVLGRDDPNEIRGVVRFEDSRSYYANARRPAQGQWHDELVALLEAPPEWWDGALAAEFKRRR